MPKELPNLKGVATKDLVETIGSGSFKASYINWSRTMQLLRDNAPGWMVETQQDDAGQVLFRVPVGAEIRLRMVHLDGTVTPWFHQAIMDNRNSSIVWDKISARDVTDTHRRGSCACLAYFTGLAGELWAKMPLESGYQVADEATIEKARQQVKAPAKTAKAAAPAAEEAGDKQKFLDLAKKMGLCEDAINELVSKIKGNFTNGLKTLQSKDEEFVSQMNEKFLAAQY